MKYIEFKNKVLRQPVIFSRDAVLFQQNKQVVRNQLERWCARGLLIKLKRGVYLLNPDDRKIDPSMAYLANQLYSPSYVSLEYALNYYGLIPERVSDVTSVATKKTFRVKNNVGLFTYQHVKTKAFRGFRALKDDAGLSILVAEPEKAIVDFLYFNLDKFKGGDDENLLEESYRLQNLETLKSGKVSEFARFFGNSKLTRVCSSLIKLIKKEGSR